MTLIKNVEIWFAKVVPEKPNSKFNRKNPTWEIQIRTRDKAQKKEWENLGLQVKTVDPDEGELYYRANLRKKTIKADGEAAGPVEVVYGDRTPADPATIGNGSIGNVRIFQYEYEKETGGKGTANVLMGIQLTKHIKYVPKIRDDDFQDEETEIVEAPEEPEEEETSQDDNGGEGSGDESGGTDEDAPDEEQKPAPKKTPSVAKKDKFD